MRFALRLLLLVLLAHPVHAAETGHPVTMWEVSGAKNSVYLLGSIHLLRQEDYPLPTALDTAYANADVLIMEIDMDDLDPFATQAAFTTYGVLQDDRTLRDLMGAELYEQALSAAEAVDIQHTNTTAPPPKLPSSSLTDGRKSKPATTTYTVTITQPANETSMPMGPGNFSVSVRIYPPLKKYESLQLFMDGEPRGLAQAGMIWDLTNVFRGQHDITVGVINADGESLAMSPPVRVFVHRPSKNFRNR